MPKLIWEKKLQEVVNLQQGFGWSVRDKRGKVLLQRYYPVIKNNFNNYNNLSSKSILFCGITFFTKFN